jgi:hypothetical protein
MYSRDTTLAGVPGDFDLQASDQFWPKLPPHPSSNLGHIFHTFSWPVIGLMFVIPPHLPTTESLGLLFLLFFWFFNLNVKSLPRNDSSHGPTQPDKVWPITVLEHTRLPVTADWARQSSIGWASMMGLGSIAALYWWGTNIESTSAKGIVASLISLCSLCIFNWELRATDYGKERTDQQPSRLLERWMEKKAGKVGSLGMLH